MGNLNFKCSAYSVDDICMAICCLRHIYGTFNEMKTSLNFNSTKLVFFVHNIHRCDAIWVEMNEICIFIKFFLNQQGVSKKLGISILALKNSLLLTYWYRSTPLEVQQMKLVEGGINKKNLLFQFRQRMSIQHSKFNKQLFFHREEKFPTHIVDFSFFISQKKVFLVFSPLFLHQFSQKIWRRKRKYEKEKLGGGKTQLAWKLFSNSNI